MFVEHLTKEDLIDYLTNYELVNYNEFAKSRYDFNAIEDYKVKEGKITFRIRDIKLKFTDFDYNTNYTIKLYNGVHNKSWINFMYKKFGSKYKAAFLTFREQEKSAILEATAKRFDEDTSKYENGLKK